MTSRGWLAIAIVVATPLAPRRGLTQEPIGGRAEIVTPDDRAGPRFGVAVLTRGSESAA